MTGLNHGVLLALAVVFTAVAAVFALGTVWALANGEFVFLITQPIMTLAFALLAARLWRLARRSPARS